MTAVRFTPEDVRALDRALMTMEAERAAAEKWRVVDLDAERAQERLADLRDRMLAEQALATGAAVLPKLPTLRPVEARVDMGAVRRLEDVSRRHAS